MANVIENMFSDVRGADRAQRIEDFKGAMSGALDEAFNGGTRMREIDLGRHVIETVSYTHLTLPTKA